MNYKNIYHAQDYLQAKWLNTGKRKTLHDFKLHTEAGKQFHKKTIFTNQKNDMQ